MLSNVLLVYRKDLKETLRDRRTLLRLLIISVLMLPALGHFMTTYSQSFREKAETAPLRLAVVGGKYLPQLVSAYSADNGFEKISLPPAENIENAVLAEQIDVGLQIPDGADALLAAGEHVSVSVYYDNADSRAEFIKERATRPIVEYNDRLRDWRLTFLGVTGQLAKNRLLNPLNYEEKGTASTREVVGQRYGGLLSYFAFLICFMGCAFAAVDLGAGEKERGTLEALLMLPAHRRDLVLGKYSTVMSVGIVYSSLSMFSIAGWLYFEDFGTSAVSGQVLAVIGPIDLLLVWLMLLPIAGIFAALLLSLSIYARSFREASGLAGLFNLLIIVAVLFANLPGVELRWPWIAVPVTNVALAIRELLKGTIDYATLLAIVGSSTVIAGVLLLFCTKWFERESVIFRE